MHTNQSGSYKNADNKIKRNQEQARAEHSYTESKRRKSETNIQKANVRSLQKFQSERQFKIQTIYIK